MSVIHFSETKLTKSGKQGILTPDKDGYYEIVIGALNAYNVASEYYLYDGAKHLFETSSHFMRSIKEGNLKGELGHPKLEAGMSMKDYLRRIMTIDEQNICVHYSDVYLDTEFGRKNPQYNNPKMVGIIAKLKPTGNKGHALESSLNNKKENTCFSIRALTRDEDVNGIRYRTLVNIRTWDHVFDNGINVSNKWSSPALESVSEVPLSMEQLEMLADDPTNNIAMESCGSFAKQSLKMVTLACRPMAVPHYSKW